MRPGPTFRNIHDLLARLPNRVIPKITLDKPIQPRASVLPVQKTPPLASDVLTEKAKAAPCKPCQEKAAKTVVICEICGGPHATDTCPIPENYDGNYQLDSGGSPPCNC